MSNSEPTNERKERTACVCVHAECRASVSGEVRKSFDVIAVVGIGGGACLKLWGVF